MEEQITQKTKRAKPPSISPAPLVPYRAPRYRVTLVCEDAGVPSAPKIETSKDAEALFRPCFEGLDREQFLVCGLDAKHRVIGMNLVSIGSLTLAIVHPREVFKALILMNAAAFLCAHNHPSSDPMPSQEDQTLTQRLRQGADLLGISLLDHLVLGEDRYYSFSDHAWPGS